MLFVWFCINLYPLHKKTSLMKPESGISTHVEKHIFRVKLNTMPFNKTIAIGLPWVLWAPSHGLWQQHSCFFFCEAGFPSNQKGVVYSHSTRAAIVLTDLSCHTSCRHGFQCSQLANTAEDVSSPALCTAPSSTVKATGLQIPSP